jgi:hypothetical protein
MFKAIKAKTVDEYLSSVPSDRQSIINFLHKFIQESASSLKPHLAYNMLGYGSFQYKNYKKEMIEWPVIALANQKNYVSIYVCAVDNGEYLAEKRKESLGKVSVGKSCIRFKRIDDLNLPELKKLIAEAARNPGLEGVSEFKKKKAKL